MKTGYENAVKPRQCPECKAEDRAHMRWTLTKPMSFFWRCRDCDGRSANGLTANYAYIVWCVEPTADA